MKYSHGRTAASEGSGSSSEAEEVGEEVWEEYGAMSGDVPPRKRNAPAAASSDVATTEASKEEGAVEPLPAGKAAGDAGSDGEDSDDDEEEEEALQVMFLDVLEQLKESVELWQEAYRSIPHDDADTVMSSGSEEEGSHDHGGGSETSEAPEGAARKRLGLRTEALLGLIDRIATEGAEGSGPIGLPQSTELFAEFSIWVASAGVELENLSETLAQQVSEGPWQHLLVDRGSDE